MNDSTIIEIIKTIIAESDTKDSETIEKIRIAIKNSEKPNFSTINPGEKFVYHNREWIFLGLEQGGALCITADVWDMLIFDENGCNNWNESDLREELFTNFLPTLDENDLLPYEMDLTADNGDTSYGRCTDWVGILSCDLYRKYRKYIPLFKVCVWTCTPWLCNTPHAYSVRYVNSAGALNYNSADYALGCLPACIFSINNH